MNKYIISIILFCSFSYLSISQTLYSKKKSDKYGYVDSLGIIKIPFEYSFVYTDTLKSIAFVVYDKKIKAIDKNNKILFTVFNYDNGPDYISEGLFRIVDDTTGYIGFANMEGNIIIKPTYFFAFPFSDGFSAFNTGGEINITDEHSQIIGGKWGYINKQENIVFPPIFNEASNFKCKKAKVKIGDQVFTINSQEN